MNILIISQYFWPENFRINDLALKLKNNGHDVTVLTGQPNYPGGSFFENYGFLKKSREKYHNIDIVRVPLIPRGNGNGIKLFLNYCSYALSAGVLGPILCRNKFEVIFVYEPSPVTVGIPAVIMKKIFRIPIFFWVQDLWPETLFAVGKIKSIQLLNLAGLFVHYVYSQCDKILIQSESFRTSIEKYIKTSEKVLYFPNSAEELYQPVVNENLPEGKSMPSGFRIMFAGNIGEAQGFNTILDAAELLKEYKEIQWIIIGHGRMYSWVENKIIRKRLEKTVHLLGRKTIETMPNYFSFADALLVSLKKDPVFALTIPSKLQSYLACKKPVIASLEGAGAVVVEESKAGLVCSPGDPKGLASAVLKMYEMPEEKRARMGDNGRKYFEANFEGHMLIGQLEKWMRKAAGK